MKHSHRGGGNKRKEHVMFGLISEKKYRKLENEFETFKSEVEAKKNFDAVGKNQSDNRNLTLEIELRDLKIKLREQTEADLFFTSAKIMKKLLDGEPKQNVGELYDAQKTLMEQYRLAQQASPYPSQFLQGLGLGSLPWRGK